MKNKFLVILMACVLAFGMFALVGCGGGSSASSSSAPEQTGPTDEELITEDVEGMFERIFTPDAIKALLAKSAGDSITQMESAGITIDYEGMAETFKNVIKVKVDSVTVNGDTATAAITMTYPDYNDSNAAAAMEAAMNDAIADADIASMGNDPDALSDLLNKAITAGLTSSDIPTATATDNIDYEKVDGTWQMKDQDQLDEMLESYGL